ncbi:MAG: MFS transporter [Deltaproteobacteria bacterium]|nr:MFS transporter [Deltaproteobacteria bacterium]
MSLRARAAGNEGRVLLLTGLSHFTTHFFELMFPTLAVVLAREVQLPLAEVLGWSFAGYLLFGLGALPAGVLADRFGARRVLLLGLAGMGVSALAAAESAPGRSLALCLASLGLFASFYHPAGMSLISHTIAARGRALGINGICGNLGIALTPVLTAALVERFGTRQAFALAGFAACTLAVGLSFLPIRERPDSLAMPVPAAGRSRWLLFALLCAAAMLAGISYRGNTLVQPAYFAEQVSQLHFGAVTSLVYLVGIAGQYAGGVLADRYDLRWLYLGFHAASLPLLVLMAGASDAALVGLAALFVFFSLGMQPIENSLFARFSPARWRATGYGVKFVLTFGVGSTAVQLVQWANAGGDLGTVFLYLAAVVALLVGVILLFVGVSAGEAMHNLPAPAGEAVG